MSIEVARLVFAQRQIMVHLSDGTPPWPLRLNDAVQRYIEALTAEVAELRPEAQEMAALRLQAERAGESPEDLLTGMTRTIETLRGTLEAERDATRQKIVALQRAISVAEASGCGNAVKVAMKALSEQRDHLQRHGSAQAASEIGAVLGPVFRRLQEYADRLDAQVARATG